ncbi:YggT family protein [Candidatus Saccharibacteria bacterium]|nr:YggT family protein [Candidatus Saccharibacteria bacterium]
MPTNSKKQPKPNDTTLIFTKVAKVVTYVIYAYTIVACVFLSLGFVMLLFGANPDAGFSKLVYEVASEFLQPFRGIFPLHQVSETGYFSPSILFAIIIYFMTAMALHALVTYITSKIIEHEAELESITKDT